MLKEWCYVPVSSKTVLPPPPPNRGIWPKVRPTQSSIWLLCQNAGLQCRQQKDFVILSTFCCAPHSWVIAPIFTVMLEHLRKPVKCGGRGLHGQFWNWVVQYGHLILMGVWSNITLTQWVLRCKNLFKSMSVVKNVWIGFKMFYCSWTLHTMVLATQTQIHFLWCLTPLYKIN